jgi:hypothetical protein
MKTTFLLNFFCLFFSMCFLTNAQIKDTDSSKQQGLYDGRLAVVDYDAPVTGSLEELEIRKAKNKRYDNYRLVIKNPDHDTSGSNLVAEVPHNPAIPAAESELIVIGESLTATAHLSNDKTGVYSEFTIRVSEVFKNSSSNAVSQGSNITVDSAGGIVRYPNGQKVSYIVWHEPLLQKGKSYVLFLTNPDKSPNYKILTGYELKENKVYPFGNIWEPDTYKGMDKVDFKKAIEAAAKQSSKPISTKP